MARKKVVKTQNNKSSPEGAISAKSDQWLWRARWLIPALGFVVSVGVQWNFSSTQGITFKWPEMPLLQEGETTMLKELTPREVEVDGRILKPEPLQIASGVNTSTRIYKIDDFLTRTECDGLTGVHVRIVNHLASVPALVCYDGIATLQKHLESAGLGGMQASREYFVEGTRCMNETMSVNLSTAIIKPWSYSTAFYHGESSFSFTISKRLEDTMGLLPSHGGKFQVTSYPTGSGYGQHTDCVLRNQDLRDRFATVLIYLQDVPIGGETYFPELGINFTPKKGTALIWTNMDKDGHCDGTTVHQASVVKRGYKFILQRWYYYQGYETLGVRQDEPPLPERKLEQARLSCTYEDDCRWFDEWGTDHLLRVVRK